MQNDILCLTETQLENGGDTFIYESAFQYFFFFSSFSIETKTDTKVLLSVILKETY